MNNNTTTALLVIAGIIDLSILIGIAVLVGHALSK
jgi:hypothetical protein